MAERESTTTREGRGESAMASPPPLRTSTHRKARLSGLVWVIPGLIAIGLFVYYPLFLNFRYSLESTNIFTGVQTFVGLDNYIKLGGDPVFWQALLNNILYAVISVIFQVFFALVLAAVIEGAIRSNRWKSFLRSIYFMPSAISLTVSGLLFYFIYQPQSGLLNGLLDAVGLESLQHAWLGNSDTAMMAIITISQWQGFGYTALLFAIAIQRIPREYYEAAALDGVGPIRQLFSITAPLCREMSTLMIIVTVSQAFQVFTEVMVTTSGGPNNSTQVLGTWLYRSAFIENDFGYAAAIATVIFLITLALAVAQLWYADRKRVS